MRKMILGLPFLLLAATPFLRAAPAISEAGSPTRPASARIKTMEHELAAALSAPPGAASAPKISYKLSRRWAELLIQQLDSGEAATASSVLPLFQKWVARDGALFDAGVYRRLANRSVAADIRRWPDMPGPAIGGTLEDRIAAARARLDEDRMHEPRRENPAGTGRRDCNYWRDPHAFNREITRGLTDPGVSAAHIHDWHWGIPCGTCAGDFMSLKDTAISVAMAKAGREQALFESHLAQPMTQFGDATSAAAVVRLELARRDTLQTLAKKVGADLEAELLARALPPPTGNPGRTHLFRAEDSYGPCCALGGDVIAEAFLDRIQTDSTRAGGLLVAIAHLVEPGPGGHVDTAASIEGGGCHIGHAQRVTSGEPNACGGGMYSSHPPAIPPLCVFMSAPPTRQLSPAMERRVLSALRAAAVDTNNPAVGKIAREQLDRLRRNDP